MTVIREGTATFDATPEQLLWALEEVLHHGQATYAYVDTEFDESQGRFNARVKPRLWPLLLSTPIEVTVEAQGTGSMMTARTESQPFIFGDVFDMYRGYLRDLVTSVKSQLRRSSRAGGAVPAPPARGEGH